MAELATVARPYAEATFRAALERNALGAVSDGLAILAAAERAATQRIEESKSQAKTEGDRQLATANAQIQQEVQSAKQQLREQVAQLAVAGAEKILQREVDARAHAQMLDQLKAQL